MFSHNLSNRNSYFISKEDDLDKITDLFNRNQRTVLINSDSGNGKSSLALEYGHRFIEKNKENNHVYWLKSTSDYMFIELKVLADKFGIEVLKQNEEELIIEIKDKLFYFHKKILFIFDNLDDLDYVKFFIELLNEQSNIFILITTNIVITNQINNFNQIEINGFNEKESREYLKKKIKLLFTKNNLNSQI